MNDPFPFPDSDPPAPDPVEREAETVIGSEYEVAAATTRDGRPRLRTPRYRLAQEIERGGMGVIYEARDLKMAREVAVKILRLDPVSHPESVGAFANEARIMSYLAHPGIAPIYDCGTTDDDRPYHVMKLVHGTTLKDMLRHDHLNPAQLVSVFADICQTIAFAHSRNVIHLDLKPGNVMVGSFGEVYVMDWGLARFEGSTPQDPADWANGSVNNEGDTMSLIAGTPEYMSPEQARGESVDARADVFALGAILCEILIGQAPYKGKTVRQAHRQAMRASMGEALEGLELCDTDRALVQLTKRCLAPNREDRPRNAMEVAAELSRYQETALQRVESDMNRFFELSLDMFCIADFDGYFRRINANFSRVLGYTNHELLARPFMDLVHPEDVEQTITRMSVLAEGEPVVRFTNRYRTADGLYVVLEWMAKAIEDEKIIFAVARDVTEF